MKTERLLSVLLVLTLGAQGVILYRQYFGSVTSRPPAVRDAPVGTVLNVKGLPIQGDKDAKTVLIEFSDYECPYCERHATGVGKDIKRDLVDTGKLQHLFVNNPLPGHSHAKLRATAAICAGNQQRYWEMHEALFREKPTTEESILSIAKRLTLNVEVFEHCLSDTEPAKVIARDLETASKLGLPATPSFGLGERDGDRVTIRTLIRGAQPFDVFMAAIAKLQPAS